MLMMRQAVGSRQIGMRVSDHEHSTVAFNTIEELTELCMELIPYLPLVMAWALLMVVLVFLKKEVVLRLVRRGESRAPPSFGIVI